MSPADLLCTPPPCPPTPCREWRGAVSSEGYGRKAFNGKVRYIHRWVYARANGGFLSIHKKVVLHLCDNRRCYRYDHLWCGTRANNSADMVAKGRAGQRGERNEHAKITEADVLAIRAAHWDGELPHVIAQRYGLSSNHVGGIVARRFWRHVP